MCSDAPSVGHASGIRVTDYPARVSNSRRAAFLCAVLAASSPAMIGVWPVWFSRREPFNAVCAMLSMRLVGVPR